MDILPEDRVFYLQGLVFTSVSSEAFRIKYTGNLARHVVNLGNGKIRISAPAYKITGTKSKGINKGMPTYKLTHASIGKTGLMHYAWLLNEYGSWGNRKKNVGWCYSAIISACYTFQSMLGGEDKCVIDNRLS